MCAAQNSDPPRKPGRPRDPDLESRRKAEILDMASRAFVEFGFAGTQVQVIADRLGIGNGTIYRYFPTKEVLFLAAVERGLAELTRAMDETLADPTLDPVDQIEAAITTYLQFFEHHPEMAELFIQERASFPRHHRPLYFASKDEPGKECTRQELYNRLLAAGVLRPIPAERFFSVVGDLLYGTILTNLLTGRRVDAATQAADVLDVILQGVLSETERKRRARGKARR